MTFTLFKNLHYKFLFYKSNIYFFPKYLKKYNSLHQLPYNIKQKQTHSKQIKKILLIK